MKTLFVLVCGLVAAGARVLPARAESVPTIGTDIARVAISQPYYADASALGAEAGYEWGFRNVAHVLTLLDYVEQGGFASASHFFLNVGPTSADITSATVAWVDKKSLPRLPFGFLFQAVYAEAEGGARELPAFVRLGLRTRYVRLGGAVDLSHALSGLAIGIIGALPVTESDFRVKAFGLEALRSTEEHKLDLLFGASWRGGEQNWLSLGAFANLVENDLETTGLDLTTLQPLDLKQTTSSQLVRFGVGARPAVPLGLANGDSPAAEFARNFLVLADVEYLGTGVPEEGEHKFMTGYFGANFRPLPDAWNPLARFVRPQIYGGVDTDAGWGVGVGLWPNEHGPISWLTIDTSYNTRPIAPSLGESVDTWSISVAITLPSPF